jgi:3-oxoacyl-[acyl-carrier protein] reductase
MRIDPNMAADDGYGLDGHAAIVTGGARGIGRAIADLLAARGASLVLVDVLEGRLEASAAELRGAGARVETVEGSVADPSTAARAVECCLRSWERIDILVNNAGIGGRHAPLWELSDEEWEEVLAVNARGTFNFMRAALPPMIERGSGRVVNIASVAAKEGVPGASHYASSKAAVVALTKAAAKEVARYGILVNAVTPGGFDTEIRLRPGVDPELMEASTTRVPLGRLGQPPELAQLVVFLAGPQLSFSTGAVFDISGGWSTY